MELITDNAFRIYALPAPQVRTYLPRIFARIHVPAPGDGIFVETYVAQLDQKILHRRRQPQTGWSGLQEACVDCGIVETYISLLQHPHDDYDPALYIAISTLVELATVGTLQQRRVLLQKAIACNSMNVCLDVMKNAELCSHKHSAVRFIRALCSELNYGETLSATETAELMETLTRTALDGVNSYATELLNQDKTWQVSVMVSRIRSNSTTIASKYGKRWFGMAQELLLWASHSLICRYPIPSRQYVLEILKTRPQIIDLLLDLGDLPRHDWYPETEVSSIAMEILATMYQFPISVIPGLSPPMSGPGKEARDKEVKATISAINMLVSRPNWRQKLLNAWKILDEETMAGVQRQLDRVHIDWYGEPAESDSINSVANFRGQVKVAVLRLIEMATYSESIKDEDLLSFLRVTYLASQASLALAKDSTATSSYDAILERTERLASVFRTPMNMAFVVGPQRYEQDAPYHIPAQSVGAPTALLRLLVVLAKRGALERAHSWAALPKGCAPGTDLQQVKQIMGQQVLKKLIPLVVKRITYTRESTRMVAMADPWKARAAYVEAAQLGAAVLSLDRVTNGRWKDNMRGLKKELVLCLGNAAEMSIRRQDFDAALGYALSADAVANIASNDEGITADTIAKNKRRLQTAQQGVGNSLVADVSGLTLEEF